MLQIWGAALQESSPSWLRPYFHFGDSRNTFLVEKTSDLKGRPELVGREVDIVISEDCLLRHTFTVPVEARNEVSRVVQLEAERVMPVSTSRLNIAYTQTGSGGAGSLVTVVAVRVSHLSDILKRASLEGMIVRSVSSQTTEGETVEFPTDEVRRYKFKKSALCFVLVAILAFFVNQMPKVHLAKLEHALEDLETDIADARRTTQTIAGLQKEVQALQTLADAVQQAKSGGRVLELLAVLTAASPDGVVIEEFRQEGNRVYLGGYARAPEEWVIALQQGHFFESVRLVSVLDHREENAQLFEIQIVLKDKKELGV